MINSNDERRGPGAPADRGAEKGMRQEAEALAAKTRREAEAAADAARREAEGLASAARREAETLGEAAKKRARHFADERLATGRKTVHGIADAARSAADDLEDTSPHLARYTREAASYVDEFSDAIERRSLGDIVRTMDDFARREPVAFFGTAFLAGFAVSRFLGSSSRPARRHAEPDRYTGGRDRFFDDDDDFAVRGTRPATGAGAGYRGAGSRPGAAGAGPAASSTSPLGTGGAGGPGSASGLHHAARADERTGPAGSASGTTSSGSPANPLTGTPAGAAATPKVNPLPSGAAPAGGVASNRPGSSGGPLGQSPKS